MPPFSEDTQDCHSARARFWERIGVVSVMLESLLLALVGGLLERVLPYLAFNGFHTATMNFQSFSQITFAFDVTPALLLTGIILAA